MSCTVSAAQHCCKELMPSSIATNVATPTDWLVWPASRFAWPTQPAPKTNSIESNPEFRVSCFAHLAYASSPHPATFLHTSRVSCVLHLLHPVQRVCAPPSGSDPKSRIHCMHSTNSIPSSPFSMIVLPLCLLCGGGVWGHCPSHRCAGGGRLACCQL